MPARDKLDLSMFLSDYLNDAKEGFQVANKALLALENDPTQTDRLNEIFRAVHTLKSSSAMLDFASIADLAHFSEDLLDRLRLNELPLNQNAVDVLLEIVDTLETMVRERAGGKSEKDQAAAAAPRLHELKQKVSRLGSRDLPLRQGVIAMDESGNLASFNPAAERMFGYAAAEVLGRKVEMLMPEPSLRTGIANLLGVAREVAGLRKDGSTLAIELAVHEMRLEGQRLFLGLFQEVAGRKTRSAGVPTIEKTQTIRVHVDLLDSLFNVVGELLITKNRIDTILSGRASKDLKAALGTMDRLVNQLQEDVSTARLVPVDEVFQRFPRLVRDLALEQHKEIDLVLEGRHIELDKAVLDAISEPLVHLLRNAVDHGIEPAEQRRSRHKSRRGTIKLTATRAENRILIEVADDGGGIDSARVKEVALHKGLLHGEEAAALPETDLLNLIFAPGFTTASKVTGLSGRGVGLDVVKTSVERVSGTVTVATRRGQGTCFTLQLPLATAIIQTLMVSVGDHVFAVPSDNVLETFDLKPGDLKAVGRENVLILHGETIPFFKLHDLLNLPRRETNGLIAVIIHRGEKLVGIGVDTVLDQMENIIKPFDPIAQQLRGFSGGTILGDGRVALLLDIPALL